MHVEVSRVADVVVLRLNGEFKNRKDIAPVLVSYLRKGSNKFIICMNNVFAINSVGMQALIEFQSITEAKGGGMRLCNVKEEILRTFKTSRVNEVLKIVEDDDAALMDLLKGLQVTSQCSNLSRYRN